MVVEVKTPPAGRTSKQFETMNADRAAPTFLMDALVIRWHRHLHGVDALITGIAAIPVARGQYPAVAIERRDGVIRHVVDKPGRRGARSMPTDPSGRMHLRADDA